MTTDQPDDDDVEYQLTPDARVKIALSSSFTYRGTTNYPKVVIEDGPAVLVDEADEAVGIENGNEVLERVRYVAHMELRRTVATMKAEIDRRMKANQVTETATATEQ